MCLVQPQLLNPGVPSDPLSAEAVTFLGILYALAAGCLVGAVAMFILAVRGLLHILAAK
jgi:hypothetical protein